MTIKYIPRVFCAGCNDKPIEVQRVFEPSASGGRRFILAKCHGERVELPFADDPQAEVKAFKKEN